MSHLYTSYSGYAQSAFSYSMANAIATCGYQFDLTRLRGWAKKAHDANLEFGNCIEAAVRSFYAGKDAVEEFESVWGTWRESELSYAKKEKDWDNLNRMGIKMMTQFQEERNPETGLPWHEHIVDPLFAQRLEKPNWYDGVTLEYIADVISTGDPRAVVDMKTSGMSGGYSDEGPWDTAMDNQLRTGCLVSGARHVAFLVFVKLQTPRLQWLEADVTDEMVEDVDRWLRAQQDKIVRKDFFRSWGMKGPNQPCAMCDVKAACVGDQAGLEELIQRKGRDEVSLDFLE